MCNVIALKSCNIPCFYMRLLYTYNISKCFKIMRSAWKTRWSDTWTSANAIRRAALVRSYMYTSSLECSYESEWVYIPHVSGALQYSRHSWLQEKIMLKTMTKTKAKCKVNCYLKQICFYSIYYIRKLLTHVLFSLIPLFLSVSRLKLGEFQCLFIPQMGQIQEAKP